MMKSFLRHIERCNRHQPADYIPFVLDGLLVGRLRYDFAHRLLQRSSGLFVAGQGAVTLDRAYADYAQRTDAVQSHLLSLVEDGVLPGLLGERYPVTPGGRDEALFEIDRSAASLFGIRSFGQHLNGYVRDGEQIFMWVAKRSADKRTYPGQLDQLVAGGVPVGLSLEENLSKECREEADLDESLARQARPVGALSYNVDTDRGYKYDILYCYDLELPAAFAPRCTDGEVDEFMLWPLQQVVERVLETDDFKPNCNLVIIDFLVRHGWIGPDHGEYLALMSGLRPPMRVPVWRNEVEIV